MCPNDIKRAKIDNGTFYAIKKAEQINKITSDDRRKNQ